ncbi:MAG: glycosyltransferase [Candidatus Peregrinibacteria bacterium]|nr:glycosyltransferase [Candidatus Peregrinibacteria bacterium]
MNCLRNQTIAQEIEVIVVSDGIDDATEQLMRKLPTSNSQLPRNFQYIVIEKAQQGVARNRGVERASAPLCLFISDDIFLVPEACEKHVKVHSDQRAASSEQRNREDSLLTADSWPLTAALGYTTWDPSIEVTDVMRWLERTGWQFGYSKIERYAHGFLPRDSQHQFTYTSNISIPTEIARRYPFREDVTLYGWEDVEWGLRLRDAGVRLYYEPDAIGHHHHHVTLEDSLARMETLGRSVVAVSRMNPELDRLPRGWKMRAYQFLSYLPTMRGRHAKVFLKGIAKGQDGM